MEYKATKEKQTTLKRPQQNLCVLFDELTSFLLVLLAIQFNLLNFLTEGVLSCNGYPIFRYQGVLPCSYFPLSLPPFQDEK